MAIDLKNIIAVPTTGRPAASGDAVAQLYPSREPQPSPGKLYSLDKMIGHTLNANYERLSDELGMTLEEQATDRAQYLDLMETTGFGEDILFAEMLHTKRTHARLAAPRSAEALAAEDRARYEQARRQQREAWGADDAETYQRRSDAYVNAHPDLKAYLADGLAHDPDVVERLTEVLRSRNWE